MAFVLNDRVKQTSTSTGTGTINLTGTETGFETFVTGIGDGNSCFYAIANDGTSEFEVGIGTCLLYTSPSPRDRQKSRMPSSA